MKKTKLTRSLLAACSIVALSAVMYGCVHSGGDDSATVDPPVTVDPPEPMEPTPVAVSMPADSMYLEAANMPMAGTHSISADGTVTSGGVVFSCAAGGDACMLTIAADGTTSSTGGMVTAALTEAAMIQVAQAKKAAEDKAAMEALVHRDRIIGKDRALEAAANLPATLTSGIVGEGDILISRAAGQMASVAPTGYSMSDDPALPNGNWHGSHLTQSVAGVGTNHLFVYTDIEAPTRVQFYNWDGDATTPSRYADSVTDGRMMPADAATTITPLGLGVGGQIFSAGTADLTRFPAPQSVEEGSLTQNYPNNDATTAGGAIDQVSIPGNYNGAGGRYLCTGQTTPPCSVTVAPAGAYTLVGTWTFVPELNSTAWQGDAEFMSFGWWLQEPTAATGAYTFRYYADGSAYATPSGANLAAGAATYDGRAAGKYVVQEIDDTGVVGGDAGMFTAAASLTAMFSGTMGAAGTISGTILGFESDNAGVDVSGWSMTLASQTIDDTTDTTQATSAGTQNDPDNAAFDGATGMLGDQEVLGTWTSQFFGQPTTVDAYPLGVGGVFQADNEAVSIAGAFGARR